MDAKTIGTMIAQLRKKNGLTQAALAQKLNISDKTVSKWESGYGYPEITQFPVLAALFGVSIDYLMTGEHKGIALCGNILTDLVKTINEYPHLGMLADISHVKRAVGGCVPNTGIDLAKIDETLPISAIGRIGNDEHGQYVLSQLNHYGINTRRVTVSQTQPTSFSDVMSLPSGERTFFHARGANVELTPADIDVSTLDCHLLHFGYLLLMDGFDAPDAEYGTALARFLHDVQEQGIKTSIDMVSSSDGNFPAIVRPSLKYCNYVIVNEVECCAIWGLEPRTADNRPHLENIKKAMELTAADGVQDKVIVHCKELGLCYDVATATFTVVPSLVIPKSAIKGSVGAGDAFCAGCLYGLYNDYPDSDLLEFASAAAACNLFEENSIDGMRSRNEILQLMQKYGRETL
ncbi:MAG: helix-turn-helix domain-containing protein [Clostridia bacterium]|nr:helix-turn-helix domain-containing protein [Clostridia bacterium]